MQDPGIPPEEGETDGGEDVVHPIVVGTAAIASSTAVSIPLPWITVIVPHYPAEIPVAAEAVALVSGARIRLRNQNRCRTAKMRPREFLLSWMTSFSWQKFRKPRASSTSKSNSARRKKTCSTVSRKTARVRLR